ncbi:TPA: hypothetical protein ACJG01_002838 [Salmonella enterica subsp. salamae serovar 21:z10:[z6]]|nr:hypothetical protein [Salmonella enterica subsp. salamae serovar 21:z10:[z6]]
MNKVSDVYTPELSRHKLSVRFSDNLPMIEVIRHMNNSNLCVFAALCDGHTVTTTGYIDTADSLETHLLDKPVLKCLICSLHTAFSLWTVGTKPEKVTSPNGLKVTLEYWSYMLSSHNVYYVK